MKSYFANLLGEWTDITVNGTVENQDTATYFEENLKFEAGATVVECFKYGYINVQHGNKNYRIDPTAIQIITE